MICSQCQTQNEVGRKFCMECGARLASGCPNCGAQNPDAAKFCGECGTPLDDRTPGTGATDSQSGGRAPATALGTAERRLVTVLFADLVGFTAQSEERDPEDTREFLTRYFEVARTIVERYGGTVEKFIGDAVMAVWGAPTAHEDDAERAVRAALDIVDSVPALGESLEVQVRAGLLTGEAAVTVGASGQGMVAGDLVNTASRLQSMAPPGQVLVGEATYRAANGAISFEEAGEHLLKGKQAPVPAWRAAAVVGLRRGSGKSGALEPPFTGRDEDLRLLKELFHATEREGKARLVSVIGQGGIGKSRLAWEFEKYIDGVVDAVWWHNGRSPAYGEGISYWALAEMVRGRAGIAETDETSVARSRLHEAVQEWLADEQERRWVEPRLGALLALEPMPPGSRDELFAAWRTFFERVAERGPNVMIFEDLQWADDGMLEFVAELLDRARNRPIFVVILARPELNERHPGWSSSLRNLTQMSLEPLEPERMTELVHGTVPGISDEAAGAIVERAEGIPLYAVETIRMLIDRGDLVAAGEGRYEMRNTLDRLAVPETLHALIAARLDALGESDRRLFQAAAVVGQSFTAEALAAIADAPVEAVRDRLAGMVVRQLLHVDDDPRSPERGQYQFVQGVVREVAEGSLSRADRRALHVSAARYFESLGDEELAGVLASHYVEAYRAATGPEADALAAQARVSLRGAAERAIELHSYKQALSYLEQALDVTSERTELVALHERAAMAAEHYGLFEVGMDHARAVETLSRDDGDRLGALRGATLQARTHLAQHGERPAIALLRQALEAVVDLDATPEVVSAQAELARSLMMGAMAEESVEWCDRVLAAPGIATDIQLTETMVTKGTALTTTPRIREGEIILRGAIQVAEQLGYTATALRARNNLLGVVGGEDVSAAITLLSEGYAISDRFGLRTWAYQFAHNALTTAFEHGDWDTWIDETTGLEATGFYGAWRLVEHAVRDAFRGRLDEAREQLVAAREMAGESSSQAMASLAGVEGAIAFAAGDWHAVMPAARIGWSHQDAVDAAALDGMAAGVAANEPGWVAEAAAAYAGTERHGRQADGHREALETALALVEQRWTDARAHYQLARRDLSQSGSEFWLQMLNLSVGARGAGHFPEAAEASAAAEEFFTRVGAQPFLDRYREAFVPTASSAKVKAPTTKPASEVGAS